MQAAVGVVQKGLRPALPLGTPQALAHVMGQCWVREPEARPGFESLKEQLEVCSLSIFDLSFLFCAALLLSLPPSLRLVKHRWDGTQLHRWRTGFLLCARRLLLTCGLLPGIYICADQD